MIRQVEEISGERDVRVLDERGCLTPEALCFTEQLTPQHQGAVERHLQHCPACAQQQATLTRAAARFQQDRPRYPLPPQVQLFSRKLALRSLGTLRLAATQQRQRRDTDLLPRRRPRLRRTTLVVLVSACALLAGALLAFLILLG